MKNQPSGTSTVRRTLFAGLLALTVAGCGQTGPLYLPTEPPPEAQQPGTSPAPPQTPSAPASASSTPAPPASSSPTSY